MSAFCCFLIPPPFRPPSHGKAEGADGLHQCQLIAASVSKTQDVFIYFFLCVLTCSELCYGLSTVIGLLSLRHLLLLMRLS